MNFFTTIFDFFLPSFCLSCGAKLGAGSSIVCNDCLSKIKMAPEHRLTDEFNRKYAGKGIISGFHALYIFEKDKELQKIIHALKYNKRFLSGKFLGTLLADSIKDKMREWEINLIIPVPLHKLKEIERGYNQSYYIAQGLAGKTGLQIKSSSLRRSKYTQSQTTMTLIEREQNIKDAFIVKRPAQIKGKNILLIDDVITTGATTGECGKALLKSGAAKIYAASLAIAD